MATYIPRALEPVVERYSEHFKAVVVTGPRQVGKTTMLRHLMEGEAARGGERSYVTLDDTSLRMLAKRDPELFLQRFRPPVLIDEIQKAPELLPYIKMELDSSDEAGRFWLTGSQPLHLMREVSESLAGRAGVVEMLGLSCSELAGVPSEPFLPSPGYFERRAAAARPLGETEAFGRIWGSTLPGIAAMPEDMKAAAYESYVDTYVMRDVRDLANVTDELRFRRFMSACAALTARPVVYAELARVADVDEKTAKAWLSLLVSSYILKVVPPYANNILKRLSKQPVMHFTDPGLAAYLAGWDGPRTLASGAFAGQAFESWAFCEVLKSYLNAGRRAPVCFFRSNDRKEIDILVESDGVVYPVEVKKSASPRPDDAKNFPALDPIASDDVPPELAQLKREVGTGCVLCLARGAYPVSRRAWAFPVWAV